MSGTIARIESDRLSAEHRGLARHFMERMAAATGAAIPQMQAVADDAFCTLQRRHKAALRSINRVQDIKRAEKAGLRPDYLTSIEKRYREIPALGCVGISIKRPDRYSIAVRDVRIGHRKIAAPRWEGGTELGAVLIANVIEITRDTAKIHCEVIASLGSHAIGRRIQRGFDNREAAIIADLAALAAAAPDLIAQGEREFEVPVPSGRWVGAVAKFENLPSGGNGLAANVRTFKS